MLHRLAEWSFEGGQADEAVRYGREAVELAQGIGDRMHGVYAIALLARIAAEDGRVEQAGLMWGALEAEEERGTVGQCGRRAPPVRRGRAGPRE